MTREFDGLMESSTIENYNIDLELKNWNIFFALKNQSVPKNAPDWFSVETKILARTNFQNGATWTTPTPTSTSLRAVTSTECRFQKTPDLCPNPFKTMAVLETFLPTIFDSETKFQNPKRILVKWYRELKDRTLLHCCNAVPKFTVELQMKKMENAERGSSWDSNAWSSVL